MQQERMGKHATPRSKIESNIQTTAPSAFSRIFGRVKHVDPKELTREVQHLFPTMGFFCLPFLAALLLAAYPRSGRV
jgi:hypothetical protein